MLLLVGIEGLHERTGLAENSLFAKITLEIFPKEKL
jgi:hypothetical protein